MGVCVLVCVYAHAGDKEIKKPAFLTPATRNARAVRSCPSLRLSHSIFLFRSILPWSAEDRWGEVRSGDRYMRE